MQEKFVVGKINLAQVKAEYSLRIWCEHIFYAVQTELNMIS